MYLGIGDEVIIIEVKPRLFDFTNE
jgi:hypothetical protein